MPSLTAATSRLGSTLVLLLPALWNRFPILEYDTGGYLARWFEGTLVPSRSTTYGLFLAAGWPLDFWPIVIIQAAAAVWTIELTLRTHGIPNRPTVLLAITALLSTTTALPWLASELLTDIFAGLAILGFHILVWRHDQVTQFERWALVIFVAFAASTHSGTYAVLLGLGAMTIALSCVSAKLVPRIQLAQAIATLILSAVMLLSANCLVSGTLSWTPGGYGLAFARMLEDGIVTRYLNDHCPDPRLRLCPYRHKLPLNADDFLWGSDSVFDHLGRFGGLDEEMRAIVLDSLRDYPAMQVKMALAATAKQLVLVHTGYGILTTIWHTYGIIKRYTPSVVPAMLAARQQHGQLHFRIVNAINVPVAWVSMALLPLLVISGLLSQEFTNISCLAATVTLALLGNAAFCSVISHAQDRYGSRVVWIAVFTVGLAALRSAGPLRERFLPVASQDVSTA